MGCSDVSCLRGWNSPHQSTPRVSGQTPAKVPAPLACMASCCGSVCARLGGNRRHWPVMSSGACCVQKGQFLHLRSSSPSPSRRPSTRTPSVYLGRTLGKGREAVRYLIAILLPPLGLFLCGYWLQAALCLLLMCTGLGWPIASIWAVLVVH